MKRLQRISQMNSSYTDHLKEMRNVFKVSSHLGHIINVDAHMYTINVVKTISKLNYSVNEYGSNNEFGAKKHESTKTAKSTMRKIFVT